MGAGKGERLLINIPAVLLWVFTTSGIIFATLIDFFPLSLSLSFALFLSVLHCVALHYEVELWGKTGREHVSYSRGGSLAMFHATLKFPREILHLGNYHFLQNKHFFFFFFIIWICFFHDDKKMLVFFFCLLIYIINFCPSGICK